MNPSGYRLEEKKDNSDRSFDAKSVGSYKSTHSSRSSVLERAREYNRRVEEQNRRRTKSLERTESSDLQSDVDGDTPRSKSVGRAPQTGPRLSTRERAMKSVRRDQAPRGVSTSTHTTQPDAVSPRQASAVPSPQQQQQQPPRPKASPSRMSRNSQPPQQQKAAPEEGEPVVSPELLVDALSGHEDGLLAIAEKLMEHYDAGYDVMGEAIIDAFADVQKLFQHVVEAAHMEGAAFEASRREEEMIDLRRQVAAGQLSPTDMMRNHPSTPTGDANKEANGPLRHDEFVDQDVKDVLTEAIRKGTALRDSMKHDECYRMYEGCCQNASSLLPVDSDHRGRLQLSLARAESMNPDRACAILRYAMDDVLRSAMRAGRTPMPDPSKRADVVLSRPAGQASLTGVTGQVIQSGDEALASMIEEMKEILSAPVYKDTPLQEVAQRFWSALSDAQKNQQKNSERLEQSLGKLKGEFLLARAEWEEKLNQSSEMTVIYKGKYERMKETRRGEDLLDQARSSASNWHPADVSMRSGGSSHKPASVASLGNGLAIHAKKLVNSINDFNCNAMNERNEVSMDTAEMDAGRFSPTSRRGNRSSPRARNPSRRHNSTNKAPASSRAYKDFARSPQRMDL
jgi:hypothetical protein